MLIIGCDFHTRYQQMAMMDTDTGELVERLTCPLAPRTESYDILSTELPPGFAHEIIRHSKLMT